LALILRVAVVELFVVPSGSMAPVLLGHHKSVTCPHCGWRFDVDACELPESFAGRDVLCCPHCGCDELNLDRPTLFGDRLVVNKTAFEFREPRRWELAVFRCPVEPERVFVKRLIGLPGETIHIDDGDVFIDGQLCRKTLAEFHTVRLLVFDQSFPSRAVVPSRWLSPSGPCPVGQPLHLDNQNADRFEWLVYDGRIGAGQNDTALRDELLYNGTAVAENSVHDFELEADVEVVNGSGRIAVAVCDGGDDLVEELTLKPGRTYHVNVAFVDRRFTVLVDGVDVRSPIDRPTLECRGYVTQPVRVGVCGAEVKLHNARLYRDIHYTSAGCLGSATPVRLGAGEYFVLGDNSPNSRDSRFWTDSDGRPLPVAARHLIGKPIVVHGTRGWMRWCDDGR
jgi:signal peptidase I